MDGFHSRPIRLRSPLSLRKVFKNPHFSNHHYLWPLHQLNQYVPSARFTPEWWDTIVQYLSSIVAKNPSSTLVPTLRNQKHLPINYAHLLTQQTLTYRLSWTCCVCGIYTWMQSPVRILSQPWLRSPRAHIETQDLPWERERFSRIPQNTTMTSRGSLYLLRRTYNPPRSLRVLCQDQDSLIQDKTWYQREIPRGPRGTHPIQPRWLYRDGY